MELKTLTINIQAVNAVLRDNAAKAINKSVTARNWLIGYYIVHYEQNGEDRALYPIGQPLDAQSQSLEKSFDIIRQPLAISSYDLEKLYPTKVEGLIPTIEEIEAQLNNQMQKEV